MPILVGKDEVFSVLDFDENTEQTSANRKN